jgi:hypothetical protein
VVPVPKYRRIDKKVRGSFAAVRSAHRRVELDCGTINAGLAEALREAAEEIRADGDAWPNPEFRLFGRDLRSDDTYRAAVRSASRANLPRWDLRLSAEMVRFPSHDRLLVLFTNHTDPDRATWGISWHEPEVFNAGVRITTAPGSFVSQPFAAARNDYRYETGTCGKGLNTVLMVDEARGEAWTEHLPVFAQPRIQSRAGYEAQTQPSVLATGGDLAALRAVVSGLEAYSDQWQSAIDATDRGPVVRRAMLDDLAGYREEVGRVATGIAVMENDALLRRAFQLMNQTFAAAGMRSWRLFQICFVVSVLPSLYAREHPEDESARREHDTVDLLWFPTGGGKTEAFLAVVVVQMFYDRLRGKGQAVSAWIRYPLRMLSVQQLQRLIDIVAHAEDVRSADPAAAIGDPFAVGYYVGEQNAPTYLTFPGTAADKEHPVDRYYRESTEIEDGLVRYRVLSTCPRCRSSAIRVDVCMDHIRIRHVCRACSYSAPLYISDAEVYRYLPSVLVGTVDRLARAGQTDLFSSLFRGPTARCPKHGYAPFGECVERARCTERVVAIPPTRDPGPALLLQDEVHLLRESLGTYDSHYEGLVDLLAREFCSGMAPKRLAATATIEGFEQHMYQLYVRDGRTFPVKGMGTTDSAYIELDPSGLPARLYVGVLPSGRDADDVSRVIAERVAELARQRAESGEDAPDHDLLLIYVNEKNTASDIRAAWPDDIAVQVLTGDKSLDEVRRVITRVEADGAQPFDERLHALIATSVVSHGVDLERLNQMVMVGMPRSFAEYIQATSRSGRLHMGAVFTVFRWQRQRDVSSYEHFVETHERLYQLVQPVPVNHASAPALERTMTGLLAAIVYNLFGPKAHDADRRRRYQSARAVLQDLQTGVLTPDLLVAAVREAYLAGFEMEPRYRAELEEQLDRHVRLQIRHLRSRDGWTFHSRLDPQPVSSLREVGEQIHLGLKPGDASTAAFLSPGRGG